MRDKKIINLLIAVTFLMGLLAVQSCQTTEKVAVDKQIKLSQPLVFSTDFQKALYKTNMMIYGNEISGLTLIKKTGSDFRLVFMSEIGLKYFDMEFFSKNDSLVIHHVISVLNKKPVLEILSNDFSLIFMIFPEKTSVKFYKDSMTKSMIKEYKRKGQKSKYIFDPNFGTVSSIHDKKRGKKNVIAINKSDHPAPQTINFNQRGFNLRMERLD